MQQIGKSSIPADNIKLEEEIDIGLIFDTLKRNKKIIFALGISGFVFSSLIAFNTKRVWQGQFQIVIDNGQSSSQQIRSGIPRLDLLKTGTSSKLQTEIGILKSPAVLMDIFNFVKNEKGNNGLKFNSWQSSFSIELEKGTSILNFIYQDTEKDLILPVLSKVSSIYQDYSGRKRKRKIKLGIDYYENQISKYQKKSNQSASLAQQFSIKNDLTFLPITTTSPDFISTETSRVSSANSIRELDIKLSQIKNSDQESKDQIVYLASTIPSTNVQVNYLKDVESKLARLRINYKETDKIIKDLKQERLLILDFLEKEVKAFLNVNKAEQQSIMKSLERPEEVLIKHNQLVNNAFKDSSTLEKLQDDYRLLLLEKARSEDPWELITKPTLLPSPVAPRIQRILALGSFVGLLLGITSAFIYDKRKTFIDSSLEVVALTKWPVLSELSLIYKHDWESSIEFGVSNLLFDFKGAVGILSIGDFDDQIIKLISGHLTKSFPDCKFKNIKDLREAIKFSKVLVISAKGVTKRKELISVSQKLNSRRESILGLIFLSNNNK